mmetsp:Transcript_49876/g.108043  ORF Transcript_49876/g.108043 Transcript_49876/m.108043 type:complete len:306 (+) Transcript_49876:233-1150(+)
MLQRSKRCARVRRSSPMRSASSSSLSVRPSKAQSRPSSTLTSSHPSAASREASTATARLTLSGSATLARASVSSLATSASGATARRRRSTFATSFTRSMARRTSRSRSVPPSRSSTGQTLGSGTSSSTASRHSTEKWRRATAIAPAMTPGRATRVPRCSRRSLQWAFGSFTRRLRRSTPRTRWTSSRRPTRRGASRTRLRLNAPPSRFSTRALSSGADSTPRARDRRLISRSSTRRWVSTASEPRLTQFSEWSTQGVQADARSMQLLEVYSSFSAHAPREQSPAPRCTTMGLSQRSPSSKCLRSY